MLARRQATLAYRVCLFAFATSGVYLAPRQCSCRSAAARVARSSLFARQTCCQMTAHSRVCRLIRN